MVCWPAPRGSTRAPLHLPQGSASLLSLTRNGFPTGNHNRFRHTEARCHHPVHGRRLLIQRRLSRHFAVEIKDRGWLVMRLCITKYILTNLCGKTRKRRMRLSRASDEIIWHSQLNYRLSWSSACMTILIERKDSIVVESLLSSTNRFDLTYLQWKADTYFRSRRQILLVIVWLVEDLDSLEPFDLVTLHWRHRLVYLSGRLTVPSRWSSNAL